MFCTRFSPAGSSTISRSPTQRELYLHSIEQEHEEILTEAYSHKTTSSSDLYSPGVSDFGYYAKDNASSQTMFNEHGRQRSFQETASQRQERLEFIRRQEHARRLAQKARQDPSISDYAIKRLPTPHLKSLERLHAAIKIQRAYRAYRAMRLLELLERRIIAAANPSNDSRAALNYLRARATELGALGAFLDAAPHMTDEPRVLRIATRVTKNLRCALDQVEATERQREKGVWVHTRCIGNVGGRSTVSLSTIPEYDSGSDSEDFDYSPDSDDECVKKDSLVYITPSDDSYYSSDSDSSDYAEEDFELSLGTPEGADKAVSEARKAALAALLSGSEQHKQWIAQILEAKPMKCSGGRSNVSKVPALLTITEGVAV